MHRIPLLATVLAIAATPAFAAPKSCDDLLAEITQKIEKNGARTYVLEILPAAQPDARAVVGTCETGTKKIVYAKQ
jgi:transcriptional regulatory protein LevR